MAFWKAGLVAISIAGLGACGGGSSDGSSTAGNGAAATAGTVSGGTATSSATKTTAAATLVSPAFYVSPTGSDSNSGTSASAPFKTFEKAQSAMQASTTKTVYLMGGTWGRTTPLLLTSKDAGESWLGYPGQKPVIDGETKASYAIGIRGNNITVRYLQIQSFIEDGIVAQYVSGALIDSNKIQDIHSTEWSTGAILLQDTITNTTVSHNDIYNTQYGGIVAVNGAGDVLTNVKVEYNSVSKTCTLVSDCGGIYFTNHDHTATGTVIENNVIGNYGLTTNQSKGIYLDDEMSNATVENNIVYGTGTWAIQIHGGDHNTFKNNIFDITDATALGIYQWDGATYPNYGMAENVVSCNIVYSTAKAPYMLWKYDLSTGIAVPTVSQNIYWSSDLSAANFGSIVDTAPIWKNPDFVNAAGANYNFTAGAPTGCTFTAIVTSTVGLLSNP
jgi:hypothetical protein